MSYCTKCQRPVDDTCAGCPIAFGPDHDNFIIETEDRIQGKFAPGHTYNKTRLGKRSMRGSYIVAYKLRRRNAKRHIVKRFPDIEEAKKIMVHMKTARPDMDVHIYNSQWEVIE